MLCFVIEGAVPVKVMAKGVGFRRQVEMGEIEQTLLVEPESQFVRVQVVAGMNVILDAWKHAGLA